MPRTGRPWIRISPPSGSSKPAIRRRQVVLPEPEGPSMAKNSPSATAKLTPSTARTSPKRRTTLSNSTAAAMGSQAAPAQDRDVVRHPAVVGHAAGRLAGALRDRGAPEVDALEVLRAVGLAALGAEQLVALAGGRDYGHRAEPGGQIPLELRLERVLEPLVGAVRVLDLGVHHRRVGPARGPLLGEGAGDRRVLADQQVDLERPG